MKPKQTEIHKDQLYQTIIDSCEVDPAKEDFWAVVVLSKDKWPIYGINGELAKIVKNVIDLLAANQIDTKGEQFQILTFHGEKAQWAMEEIAKAPDITTLHLMGNVRELFPEMSANTSQISLNEKFVTP